MYCIRKNRKKGLSDVIRMGCIVLYRLNMMAEYKDKMLQNKLSDKLSSDNWISINGGNTLNTIIFNVFTIINPMYSPLKICSRFVPKIP